MFSFSNVIGIFLFVSHGLVQSQVADGELIFAHTVSKFFFVNKSWNKSSSSSGLELNKKKNGNQTN